MILNFEKIDDDSRLWIYQSNRVLSNHEKIFISEKIGDFLKSWTSHGNDLFCSFKIKYDLFIFIVFIVLHGFDAGVLGLLQKNLIFQISGASDFPKYYFANFWRIWFWC